MTAKGLAVLEHLIAAGLTGVLSAVVIGSDKQILEDAAGDIEALCISNKIRYYHRTSAPAVTSEYAIAVSWRWLINLPATRLIVLHDSLLPAYRGFAPLVNQLINGEKNVGVTALFATEEYDRGDILAQESVSVTYPVTISQAIELISPCYARLVETIIRTIGDGEELKAVRQDESRASYSLWRDEEDYKIDWSADAPQIRRFVDAVGFPYKGASALLDDSIVRIQQAEALEDVKIENRTPGKVIYLKDGCPVIVCGEGLLKIINATYDDGSPLLPLRKFRSRFK